MTSPDRKTHVLIVDDGAVTRQRLCGLLAELPEVEVDACRAQAAELGQALDRCRPALVIIDVPVSHAGFQLVTLVRERLPATRIVVLSNHPVEEFQRQSLASGADRFLVKATQFERVLELARAVGAER